jgi:hypothetical protein
MILESSGGSEFFLDKTNVVIPELSYMEKGGRKERPHSPFREVLWRRRVFA